MHSHRSLDDLQVLKSTISPSAARIAKVVADEISRRYTPLYSHITMGSPPLNPLIIVRYKASKAISTTPHKSLLSDSRPRLLSTTSIWSISAEIIENYTDHLGPSSAAISSSSPMASSASLSSTHSYLATEYALGHPIRKNRFFYTISLEEAVNRRSSSLEANFLADRRWRLSLSNRSSKNQSPRESLHDILSFTMATNGENRPSAEISSPILENQDTNLPSSDNHWSQLRTHTQKSIRSKPSLDSSNASLSLRQSRSVAAISPKQASTIEVRSLEHPQLVRQLGSVRSPHAYIERELMDRERRKYQARAR